jgi:hypothetical protein
MNASVWERDAIRVHILHRAAEDKIHGTSIRPPVRHMAGDRTMKSARTVRIRVGNIRLSRAHPRLVSTVRGKLEVRRAAADGATGSGGGPPAIVGMPLIRASVMT